MTPPPLPTFVGNAGPAVAWYCLKTKVKRESFAANALIDRSGLEVFAPRLQVRRKGMREGRTLAEPLFPGYVFCRLDFKTQLRLALSTPDVTGIVRFGERTPTVAEDVITFLRSQTSTPHVVAPVLTSGEWVEVLTGSFMGNTGQVISFNEGSHRACILLALLGSEVRVTLPVADLQSLRPVSTVPFPLQARPN